MDAELAQLCWQSTDGIAYVMRGEAVSLERSKESGRKLLVSIMKLIEGEPGIGSQKYGEPLNAYFTGPIKTDLDTFQIALSEELKLLPVFSVEEKGNLSIDRLVDAASAGYAPSALGLLDDFMKREIDEAGRCLAFGRSTACGYHILRAVEIALKAYVLSETGSSKSGFTSMPSATARRRQ